MTRKSGDEKKPALRRSHSARAKKEEGPETDEATAGSVPIVVLPGPEEPFASSPPAPGTEYAEDASWPRFGPDPLLVAVLGTVGPSGRQAVSRRDVDGLAFLIELRGAAESDRADLALRITLQIIDVHNNTVAALHTLDLNSIPGAGAFSILLGEARNSRRSDHTTAAWWGLSAGIYLSRVVFEIPRLRTLTVTSEAVFRVDDAPPGEN